MQALKDLIELIGKKPWIIFIVFTLAFGYGYYEQNEQLKILNRKVGGLQASMTTMNEIIKLKVELATELAARQCPIEE